MINKKPIVTAVDLANRFHAANFQNFSKRFNLDAAVRNGMAMYEIKQEIERVSVKRVPVESIRK